MIIVNNRDKLNWRENMTVDDVLDEMNYVFDLITVHVNGTFVPQEDYDEFVIPDDAQVGVFHLAHGG